MKKVIFLDRDGTLIVEPPITEQVNSLEEMVFVPYVISSLKSLYEAGFELVVITNQEGLGTPANKRKNYELINRKMFEVFASVGIKFSHLFECAHDEKDKCKCRKPGIGMVKDYLAKTKIDRSNSFVVGDRKTDIEFAKNIGLRGFMLSRKLNWQDIMQEVLYPKRVASVSRKTKETDITVKLNLDGTGQYNIKTSIKFLDHMLQQLAAHSEFDLTIKCKGDLDVDEHHTIEDIALVLGSAFKEALGDKKGVERFAYKEILVMDEAKTQAVIDIGRPSLKFKAKFSREYVGDFPSEMLEHFLHSFCMNAGINLHITITGQNVHHQVESCFKALARCLKGAVKRTRKGPGSTKGVL